MEIENIIQTLTPAIASRMLTTEQREAFEQGLAALEQTPRAASFVRESRRFRDYHRRVRQLLTYLQTMQTATLADQRAKSRRPMRRPRRRRRWRKRDAVSFPN